MAGGGGGPGGVGVGPPGGGGLIKGALGVGQGCVGRGGGPRCRHVYSEAQEMWGKEEKIFSDMSSAPFTVADTRTGGP